MAPVPRAERLAVGTLALLQFLNIVDFVMVVPLGPFFAPALDISLSELGLLTSAYTAAACLAGVAGSFVLDRFDRRRALAVTLLGLMLATAVAGLANTFEQLLAARFLAGLFGGPATSLCFSAVADLVPPERRGRAMSTVMAAFSAAAVAGVPLSLQLAEWGGHRAPFFGLAAAGAVLAAFGLLFGLPPLRDHLDAQQPSRPLQELKDAAQSPTLRRAWLMTAVVMSAPFLLTPNFPAYLTGNLAVPREHFKFFYLAGGLASLATFRVAGGLVDLFGSFRVAAAATAALAVLLYFYVVRFIPGTPVMLLFVAFVVCMNLRNVAYNSLASRVPPPGLRARFQSIQSAVHHASAAVAAAASAAILVPSADGGVLRMETLGLLAISLSLLGPLIIRQVERGLGQAPSPPAPTTR